MQTFTLIAEGLATGADALFIVWMTYQALELAFPLRPMRRAGK